MSENTNLHTTTAFEAFVASGPGRVLRTVMGLGLVVVGTAFVPRPLGRVVAVFGLLPLTTGVFNICPVAPLWGGHFLGSRYCAMSGRSKTA